MAGNIAKSMMSELGYNVTVDVITHKMLTTHCDIFEHIKVFMALSLNDWFLGKLDCSTRLPPSTGGGGGGISPGYFLKTKPKKYFQAFQFPAYQSHLPGSFFKEDS